MAESPRCVLRARRAAIVHTARIADPISAASGRGTYREIGRRAQTKGALGRAGREVGSPHAWHSVHAGCSGVPQLLQRIGNL
jgi:hypothetical protein